MSKLSCWETQYYKNQVVMNLVWSKFKKGSTLVLGLKGRVGYCWTKVDKRKVLEAHIGSMDRKLKVCLENNK